jgi:hypothetical protein
MQEGWIWAAALGVVAAGCITINEAPETVTTTRTVTVPHTVTTTQTAFVDGQASGAQGFGFYYEWYDGDPYVLVLRVPDYGIAWSRIVMEGCTDWPRAGFVYPGDVTWDCNRQDRVRIWLEPEHRLLFDHESPLAGSDVGDAEEYAPDMGFSKNTGDCTITVVKAPAGNDAVTWEMAGGGDDIAVDAGNSSVVGIVDGDPVNAGDIITLDGDDATAGNQCSGTTVTIRHIGSNTLLYVTSFA